MKKGHLLLPRMPTFRLRAADIKTGSGGIRTSDQGLIKPLVYLAISLFMNGFVNPPVNL